jgi:hypothetical protein
LAEWPPHRSGSIVQRTQANSVTLSSCHIVTRSPGHLVTASLPHNRRLTTDQLQRPCRSRRKQVFARIGGRACAHRSHRSHRSRVEIYGAVLRSIAASEPWRPWKPWKPCKLTRSNQSGIPWGATGAQVRRRTRKPTHAARARSALAARGASPIAVSNRRVQSPLTAKPGFLHPQRHARRCVGDIAWFARPVLTTDNGPQTAKPGSCVMSVMRHAQAKCSISQLTVWSGSLAPAIVVRLWLASLRPAEVMDPGWNIRCSWPL